MSDDAAMTEMSGDADMMPMDSMGADDCDDMSNEMSESHDAGCAAACALVCPGFYSGPDFSAAQEPALPFAQYATPHIDPGPATPSHLDPPPPRI